MTEQNAEKNENTKQDRRGIKFFWLAIALSLLTFFFGIGYVIYLTIAHPPHMGG